MNLTSHDLLEFLASHAIAGEILHLPTPTPSVDSAAQAVGVSAQQIVKSILFLVAEQPVLAIACGNDPIERRVIAALYQVGRKKVRLADNQQVLEIAGYEAGAMPPFGHRQPLPTLLDQRVLAQPVVYAGGGGSNALLRLSPADIQRITGARLIDLITPPNTTASTPGTISLS